MNVHTYTNSTRRLTFGKEKISFIANYNMDESGEDKPEIDEEKRYPVLPLRNMLLFPKTMMPVTAGRKTSCKLLKKALHAKSMFVVAEQIDPDTEVPDGSDIYRVGVMARVIKIIQMSDEVLTAVVQGFGRVRIGDTELDEDGQLSALVSSWPEEPVTADELVFKTTIEACKDALTKLSESVDVANMDLNFPIDDKRACELFINFVANGIPARNVQRIAMLESADLLERAQKLLAVIHHDLQVALLKEDIKKKTQTSLDEQQRQFFLRREMDTIRGELGEEAEDSDYATFMQRASEKKWNTATHEVFAEEAKKLNRMAPQSPEYSNQYEYLNTMLSLPWNEYTKDNFNLKKAEKTLNKRHFGMEKVKERILEQLAVLSLRGDVKAPILCLYGPPGVGKTSLCKSIAEAMGRKYVRMSLGGLHDESEIRGHRRTYIGSMPGRIIKGIKEAGSSNPVFVLDEIDKVTQDSVHGDPSSALLEVLDPEQNNAFHDNYIDTNFDLSKVLFIATANNISTIPGPLLDRMELINVSGYLTEEKIEIAKHYLIPKELENLGLDKHDVSFKKSAIEKVIEDYTRESGVRELDKKIAKILRKVALGRQLG